MAALPAEAPKEAVRSERFRLASAGRAAWVDALREEPADEHRTASRQVASVREHPADVLPEEEADEHQNSLRVAAPEPEDVLQAEGADEHPAFPRPVAAVSGHRAAAAAGKLADGAAPDRNQADGWAG